MDYLPHIDQFLRALRINRDRLNSRSKVAIDAKLLRMLLQALAEAADFSEEFYLRNNSDIADAHARGEIESLRAHFVELGFFEGRAGSAPPVDEAYYTATYADVAEAVRRGDVKSGAEHYLQSGAAEGRVPNPALKPAIEAWAVVLRDDLARV
jgi:hypothetical protein